MESKYKQMKGKFKRWCKSHEHHDVAVAFNDKGPQITDDSG